ncbi:TPA: hypothetical protein ACGUUK_001077 [Vibrio vulnificus]|uniref:hypothetical protein n=1 Tax=Vibrio vulnificus TaxID=672 RepID=UPI001A1F0B7D|nr:hypothetical protein [Vibrio vulnificus]ELC9582192.1 hypothetical protein [Vibrio vulnificus]ELV8663519.1 hypothetical protein [Vibrio vulnificus]MCU8262583.1 hypothetical protein [Vibrio vulnificus]MCU8484626.1 hypothetical protein [Vibrio vulnificus]
MLDSYLINYAEYLFDQPEKNLQLLQKLAKQLGIIDKSNTDIIENTEYRLLVKRAIDCDWYHIVDYKSRTTEDAFPNEAGLALYPFNLIANKASRAPESVLNELYNIGRVLNSLRNGESSKVTLHITTSHHTNYKKIAIRKVWGNEWVTVDVIEENQSYNF